MTAEEIRKEYEDINEWEASCLPSNQIAILAEIAAQLAELNAALAKHPPIFLNVQPVGPTIQPKEGHTYERS